MAMKILRPETAFALDPSDKKQKRMEDPVHLAFIRKLPSVLSGRVGCEACHIRTGNAVYRKKHTGKAQKPDDAWCVPLTAEEHREQHSMSETAFWQKHGKDPFAIAMKLYGLSGEFEAAIEYVLSSLGRRL